MMNSGTNQSRRPGGVMNQYVIDLTASHPGLRPGVAASGESRPVAFGRASRPAWPFLVNSSAQRLDKQAGSPEAAQASGFES